MSGAELTAALKANGVAGGKGGLAHWAFLHNDIRSLGKDLSSQITPKDFSVEAKVTGYDGSMGAPTLLYVGAKCASTMHYEEAHQTFVQLHGSTRFTMLPPSELKHLYPYPIMHPNDKTVQVDPFAPGYALDEKKYPRMKDLGEPLVVTLEEGQVLAVPAHWLLRMDMPEAAITVNVFSLPPAGAKMQLLGKTINTLFEIGRPESEEQTGERDPYENAGMIFGAETYLKAMLTAVLSKVKPFSEAEDPVAAFIEDYSRTRYGPLVPLDNKLFFDCSDMPRYDHTKKALGQAGIDSLDADTKAEWTKAANKQAKRAGKAFASKAFHSDFVELYVTRWMEIVGANMLEGPRHILSFNLHCLCGEACQKRPKPEERPKPPKMVQRTMQIPVNGGGDGKANAGPDMNRPDPDGHEEL